MTTKTRKALLEAQDFFDAYYPPGCGEAKKLITEALAEPAEKPEAWMHNQEGRVDVIHSSVKDLWIRVGQPTGFYREKVPCKVEHYTVPLYKSSALAEPAPRRLTDEGRKRIWLACKSISNHEFCQEYGRAIEARIFGDVK